MSVLYTHITRADGTQPDVRIEFESRLSARGYPATYWEPGAPDEYEHTFVSAAIDGPGEPLTPVEMAEVRAWFEAHQSEADEVMGHEDEGCDPDEGRDAWHDYRGDARDDDQRWEDAA